LFEALCARVLQFADRGGWESGSRDDSPWSRSILPRESSTLCTSLLARERVVDFGQLAGSWDALLAGSRRPLLFTTWLWQQTWWEAFGEDASLHLLTLRDATDTTSRIELEPLIGIAPLMSRGDTLGMVGGEEVCDYLDVISRPGCEDLVVRSVLDYFGEGPWSTLRFHGIPADSPTRSVMCRLAESRGWAQEDVVEDVCPRVSLPADFDAYLTALRKKDRHELRRKLRRLFASGDVRWYAIAPGALQPQDVDDFLRLHRLNPDKNSFMIGSIEKFFRLLFTHYQPSGVLRLYFLEVDGVRVSTLVLFDYGDEYWLYNSGYDPEHQHLSVGLLLKALTVQEAIERGRRVFDFLQGDEAYKYHLGATDAFVHRLTITKTKSAPF
jgi:CelD/BcsL family acetyltransferase involved in cellulose biosynthesis